MGRTRANQACWREAVGLYEKALDLRRKIGNQDGIGSTLSNLGQCWSRLGETDKALACIEEARARRDRARQQV